jgi:hypothetical protein
VSDQSKYPRGYDKDLRQQLDRLRKQGYGGGTISMHRAMLTLPLKPVRLVFSLLMALALACAYLLVIGKVSVIWLHYLEFCRSVIGLPGYVIMVTHHFAGSLYLDAPRLITGGTPLTPLLWWSGFWVAALLLLLSFILPKRMVPANFMLRSIAFAQGTAQIFFGFWPDKFPYSITGYIEVMLIAGLMFVGLIPVLLAFIYYIFDFSTLRRLGTTLGLMLYLALFIPTQFLAHAWLLHKLSVLYMPLLFLVFGLPLNIMIFVAFFANALSKKERSEERSSGPSARGVEIDREQELVPGPDNDDTTESSHV